MGSRNSKMTKGPNCMDGSTSTLKFYGDTSVTTWKNSKAGCESWSRTYTDSPSGP